MVKKRKHNAKILITKLNDPAPRRTPLSKCTLWRSLCHLRWFSMCQHSLLKFKFDFWFFHSTTCSTCWKWIIRYCILVRLVARSNFQTAFNKTHHRFIFCESKSRFKKQGFGITQFCMYLIWNLTEKGET